VIEISLLGIPTSIRIVIAHGCETYSVFMVVNRLSGALAIFRTICWRRAAPRQTSACGQARNSGTARQPESICRGGRSVVAAWVVAPFYTPKRGGGPLHRGSVPYFAPDLEEPFRPSLQRIASPPLGPH